MSRPSVEQVAQVLAEAVRDYVVRGGGYGAFEDVAAPAVIALFEPETVTTAAELDALPVGSVVRRGPEGSVRADHEDGSWSQGVVAELREDAFGKPAWFIVGSTLGFRSHQADLLPATVLHRGGSD